MFACSTCILERNANPVIHLFHLGGVAVAIATGYEVQCTLTIFQSEHMLQMCQMLGKFQANLTFQ